jgi:type IV pilus assembly protein PilC
LDFVCRYGTVDGRISTVVQRGANAASVERELVRQGFQVFEVRPRGFSFDWSSLMPKRRRSMKLPEFLAFNQELAALLRAGLPLLQALDLMLERMEDPSLSSVLSEVRDKVRSGSELSEAFASFGDLFPPLYSSSLKAGERSGELEQVLRRFIRYLRLVIDARKRVVSALVYPSVLISLSLIMLVVMAVYVVPAFSKFYEDLEAELPTITQITLGISFWIRDYFFLIVGAVVAFIVLMRRFAATPAGRRQLDRWRLRIPLLGKIFHLFGVSEFCRALATLISGGIPLVTAAETAVQAVGNRYIAGRIEPSIDHVRQGLAFHHALEKTGIFPHMSIDMIKVGEATGQLDEMLTSVSDYLDEIVETRVQRLLTVIEPIMLVVMGAIIAVILISIYLPMFGAFSQIGK